jgi:hypothetical protein
MQPLAPKAKVLDHVDNMTLKKWTADVTLEIPLAGCKTYWKTICKYIYFPQGFGG